MHKKSLIIKNCINYNFFSYIDNENNKRKTFFLQKKPKNMQNIKNIKKNDIFLKKVLTLL